MTRPTLIFLHALGASAREWDAVMAALGDVPRLALDLPGFGTQAVAGYRDVADMVDGLADEIRACALSSWVLVGHSMGGKLATLLAARAQAGEAGLSGLAGIVLVAASPPCPEPMAEARRAEMIGWWATGTIAERDARTFVDANIAAPLPPAMDAQMIADVRRSNGQAWRGWLQRGSLEDWSDTAGRIALPALIVAGAEDGDLGEDAQRRLNLPHFPGARMETVPGAAHLIPYEQPARLAALIAAHCDTLAAPRLPDDFARLLGSDRVGARTRAAMLARMQPPAPAGLWTPAQRATVAALVARILPVDHDPADLAHRIEATLADGKGDGWRFADLPADRDAWGRGLATLDAWTGGFPALAPAAQDAWLDRIAQGDEAGDDDPALLSPRQMLLWFEDVRAETVRCWVSLPATMARIGYDGFATGGDGPRKQGYVRTAADELEPWQQPAETRS